MKILKAAAGAFLACVLCAGAALGAVTGSAEASYEYALPDTAAVNTDDLNIGEYDASQDAEYLKYKHQLVENALSGLNPVAKVTQRYNTASAFYGSAWLNHPWMFNGVDKEYGVDVCYFQPNNNWVYAKADGCEFALVRIGYRGYGSAGTLIYDPDFWKNVANAQAAGVKVGAYFYTQAISYYEAEQEARFCLAALQNIKLDLPVFFDIESVDYDWGRLDHAGLTYYQKTQLCETFCNTIESAGYSSGVYASAWWLRDMINGSQLSQNHYIWVASYGTSPGYYGTYGNYDYWQYSSSGYISGINSRVDLNVHYLVDHAPSGTVSLKNTGNTLSWNSVDGAKGYTVYAVDGSKTTAVADVTGTTYAVPAGAGAKQYYVAAYNVYSVDRYYGAPSNTVLADTRIKNLTCERKGLNTVKLSWDEVPGALYYEISTNIAGSYRVWNTTGNNYDTIWGYDLENCSARVRAFILDGTPVPCEFSDMIRLKGNGPEGICIARINGSFLSWTYAGEAEGFEVCGVDSEGGEFTLASYGKGKSYTFVDPSKSGSYYIKPYLSYDGDRYYGTASDVMNVTAFDGSAVSGLELADNKLTWSPVNGAEGYMVYKEDKNGNVSLASTVSDTGWAVTEGGCKYSVKAYTVAGGSIVAGAESDKLEIAYAAPENLRVTAKTGSYTVIGWDALAECQQYTVYVDTGSGYSAYSTVSGCNVLVSGKLAGVKVCGYKNGSVSLVSELVLK